MRILVSGMVAAVPGQGGATWAVLQYVLGLRRLGHEVVVVDPETADVPYDDLRRFGADLLLNIAGGVTDEALLDTIGVRAYLDLDPAFTQVWHSRASTCAWRGTRTS